MRRLAHLSAVLGGALAALFASSPAADAQQTFTLRLNHVLGPNEPFHRGFQDWAKRVEQRTKGGLKIQVFHSAQLGVEEDIIEQMRQGAAIGQNTDAARLGNYVKSLAVVNGPYFATSLDDVEKLGKSPTITKATDELAKQHGLKVVCFDWVQGYRHFFTNTPVKKPADLAGLRIRTPPAPIWQESIRALGAAPTAMAFGDMYPALQQRAIDGVELVYNNIPSGRFYEVLKFANETKHIMLVNFQVVGSKFFDSLPTEYQTVLVEECRKAGRETSEKILASETNVKNQLKSRGMTIVEDVDLAAFKQAGNGAYEKLGLMDVKKAIEAEIGR
ncbi:C4-dicarboxylate TRAP transporter substrate-binding protein [Bradyrhizobium cenepequi]|uniref:C4-dicarboxylate TRAP transporter substrate-binding protein n=1 Tax=Bradyrhizobium cenepequi TaxID=2821403 RepID=UPI001CE33223|nr:C4-dicarboxylate TRAP transporter substrate-binding protein [Bradyrhizobium cenepequi]MCA6108644.1 C4-dicarboxylate TRAP transporter substrate-binding protein [Bradyrhizobium cenepequi]